MYDVIIVGGGPAGSWVAYQLASLGYKVLVVEEHEKIGEPVRCTGIIGRECFDRFGLAEEMILWEANSAKFFAPSGRFLRLYKESVRACIVDRALFDSTLAQRAQEKGAPYLLGKRVDDIQILDDRVRVEIDRGERNSNFDAKIVVIAGGFGSKFAQKLGLGRIGDWVMGAQAEVSTNEVAEEIEVYFGQRIAPGFFGWLVPLPQRRALVGLFSRRHPGQHLENLLNSLLIQGKIALPEEAIAYGGIPLRPAKKTYHDRVLVVGTSAGQVKPTTGGGIYYGLICAQIAANVVHQAVSTNDFSEKLLAQYEKAWKKKLNKELLIGYYARRFYERLSDRQIDQIFSIVESNNIHESLLKTPGLAFDWHAAIILKSLKHIRPWRYLVPLLNMTLSPGPKSIHPEIPR